MFISLCLICPLSTCIPPNLVDVCMYAGLSVSWQQSEYMVSESNIPLMVCAEIVAGSLERQVSVAVEAEDGTAVAGT